MDNLYKKDLCILLTKYNDFTKEILECQKMFHHRNNRLIYNYYDTLVERLANYLQEKYGNNYIKQSIALYNFVKTSQSLFLPNNESNPEVDYNYGVKVFVDGGVCRNIAALLCDILQHNKCPNYFITGKSWEGNNEPKETNHANVMLKYEDAYYIYDPTFNILYTIDEDLVVRQLKQDNRKFKITSSSLLTHTKLTKEDCIALLSDMSDSKDYINESTLNKYNQINLIDSEYLRFIDELKPIIKTLQDEYQNEFADDLEINKSQKR